MDLKTNIGKPKYPSKTTMNMAMREKSPVNAKTLIIGIVIIAILVFCAAKFGAIDQLNRLSKAESEYGSLNSSNEKLVSQLADYDDVVMEYRQYSTDWMADYGSDATVSRQDVLDMVEKYLMPKGQVLGVNVSGDVATVRMTGMTLNEISNVFEELKSCAIVQSAELNTASSEYKTDAAGEVNITIYLQEVAE